MRDPIKIGIIGTGGISRAHHRAYLENGAEVVALAEIDPTVLKARQHDWQVLKGYTDYHELVADPEVEAVSICLPNALHHPATLAAARAGKHVLCEKPISLSLERAEEMIRVCREAGVILQINHHLRYDGPATEARKIIDSGRLGRITYLRLRQAHDWAGAKTVKESFGKLINAGGGTLLDNGCHMMDLARYFGGDVREIYARTSTLGFAVEVEDTAVVNLEFTSGALGTVETAWTATGWENAFGIYGTHGALEFSNRTGTPSLHFRFRDSPGTTWGDTDVATYTFAGYSGHGRSIHSFLLAIRGEERVVCTGEDGLEAVRLVLVAYESARANKPVALEPLEVVS